MSMPTHLDALGYLREARAAMIQLRDELKQGSRELSVAITECDTAILWLQHDIWLKTPSANESEVPA